MCLNTPTHFFWQAFIEFKKQSKIFRNENTIFFTATTLQFSIQKYGKQRIRVYICTYHMRFYVHRTLYTTDQQTKKKYH